MIPTKPPLGARIRGRIWDAWAAHQLRTGFNRKLNAFAYLFVAAMFLWEVGSADILGIVFQGSILTLFVWLDSSAYRRKPGR